MSEKFLEHNKWRACMTCSVARGCYLIAESNECCKLRGVPTQVREDTQLKPKQELDPLMEMFAEKCAGKLWAWCAEEDKQHYRGYARSLLEFLSEWRGEKGERIRVIGCPESVKCAGCLDSNCLCRPLIGKEG
ncbi:MAG: hypothetical protein WC455_15365 [Dehalococcoidia bacterium]|jgi:hypothetical protein